MSRACAWSPAFLSPRAMLRAVGFAAAFPLGLGVIAMLPEASSAMPPATVILDSRYQTWNATSPDTGDGTISQSSGQLTVVMNLRPTATFTVTSNGAWSSTELGPRTASLTGMGSVRTALSLRPARSRVLLKATATIPSGTSRFGPRGLATVEAVGQPLLGFSVRHYGTGFEGGGSATWYLVSHPGLRVAVGAGGVARGPFQFQAAGEQFHPASEWAVTGGFDLGAKDAASAPPVRLDLTVRGYGTDREGGARVYREGPQLEFQSVLVARRGPYAWDGLVRGVVKSDNERFTPASSLVASLKENTGSGGALRAGLDREMAANWRLGLVAELDLVTRSEFEGRNGTVAGIGPRFHFALGEHTSLEASSRYWRGSMDGLLAGMARRRVSGVGAGLTLRWSPR